MSDDFIAGLRAASARAQAERDAELRQALCEAGRRARAERRVVEAAFAWMGCKVLLVPIDADPG